MKRASVLVFLLVFAVVSLSGGFALAGEPAANPRAYANEDKVILNVSSTSIDVGRRSMLYTTSNANAGWHGKVVWTASDPNVLGLKNITDTSCTVLALREGTASVRATAPNGNYAECVVAAITSIGLPGIKLPLALGQTTRLEVTLHPSIHASGISWSSSNPEVASVDSSGVVTAHQFGWSVIEASVLDHEAKCAVYILPTEKEAYQQILAIKGKYKHGKRWTSSNLYMSDAEIPIVEPGVTGNLGSHMGWGCIGFALLASDAAFYNLPISYVKMTKKNVKDVKVGDIVRLRGGWHYVLVLKKDSKGIKVVEGNWQKKISWNRRLTWSYLKKNGDLMLTRYEMVTSLD